LAGRYHRIRPLDRPLLEQGHALSSMRIGDHAVITTKCTAIADVGEGTFVGATRW
jgi:hypothetical protein